MAANINIQPGKSLNDIHCFECHESGCVYNDSGTCIYNIAKIQINYCRACHEENALAEVELMFGNN